MPQDGTSSIRQTNGYGHVFESILDTVGNTLHGDQDAAART